jgi:hypothetical protein
MEVRLGSTDSGSSSGRGQTIGGEILVACELGGAIQHHTQIHQGTRTAGRAPSIGIAHAVAVKAEDGKIKWNCRLFQEWIHLICNPIVWSSHM